MKHNVCEQLEPLLLPIDDLVLDKKNTRFHNQDSIDAIAISYQSHGQRKPIVVQANGMIVRAGNGQVEAAKKLGWTHMAAVVIDEDDKAALSFAIADNRSAEKSMWNMSALSDALTDLADDDLLASTCLSDVEVTGVTSVKWKGDTPGDINSARKAAASKDVQGEVNVNELKTNYECPRCGFEF